MKTNVLLDTNILIYAYDSASPYHAQAVAVLMNAAYDLFTTTKNISEYFAVLSKQNQPFNQVWTFYEDLKKNTQILFPTPTSLAQFEQLIQKYQPRGNKVFDIEITSIALGNSINTIATVNTKDFDSLSEIKVLPV